MTNIYQKHCGTCKNTKNLTDFSKNSRSKDGYCTRCKDCQAQYFKQYRQQNSKELSDYQKEYRQKNAVTLNEYSKQWRKEHPGHSNAYHKERKSNDPLFHLICNTRIMINKALERQNFTKTSKTAQILGCSYEEFYEHIENQFTDGMSWQNKHLWDIDHNVPLAWATTEEEILSLNHHSNLQPLWKEDNNLKSDNYAGDTKTILEMHSQLGVGFRTTHEYELITKQQ